MPNDLNESLLSRVSGPGLMHYTAEIAKWVRDSGEPDELESFKWIKAKMEEFGYETELLHHRAYISLPEAATLEVSGSNQIIEGISHAFAVDTPGEGLRARLVDSRSEDASFEGTIVLVDGMANAVSFKSWEARGAIGQVHIHDDHLHETSISPVWGNPTEDGLAKMPNSASMAIRQADGSHLRELLQRGPVEVTLRTKSLTEWRPIPLLTAKLPGTPASPYLLLSTHVDSWYYGAMDNGSANATTLEVARILAEERQALRRGVRVAFWSGHSHGRFAGSAWYADENWLELHDNCLAHVFVDSTGGQGATVITEPPVMPQTHSLAAEVIEAVTGEEFEGKRIGRFADQSFYGIGLNSIFGTLSEQEASASANTVSFKTGGRRAGGLGWWWHTPDDTLDKVDEKLLVRDTQIYLAAVHLLLTAPLLPFDYRPAIDEIVDTLHGRIEAAQGHLDLSGLLEDLGMARDAIYELHQAILERQEANGAGSGTRDLGDLNDVLLRLSRHLVPIAFHEHGRFDRDPAAPLVPVPSLKDLEILADLEVDDPEAQAIATRLHRAANRVRFGLREATRVARGALSLS